MAYRIRRRESVALAIRRIAKEQIDQALDEIADERLDRQEAVHQVRKRCKKIRGLLRLVRPQMSDHYELENAFFRDAAGALSRVRDAEVMAAACDKLFDHFADQIDRAALAPIRETLDSRRRTVAQREHDLPARLAEFASQMREARQRTASWTLDAKGFSAIEGGLKKTYRRGRKAMAAAYRDGSPEAFHQWRKRAKYHWYHTRLLHNLWKPVLACRCELLKELSDLLGDDHDLAVLRSLLAGRPDDFGEKHDVESLIALIDRRRAELEEEAQPIGDLLYAEKPKRLAKRLRRRWKGWREKKSAAEA